MVRVLPDSSWHFRRFFPDGATLIEKHAKEKKRRVVFGGIVTGLTGLIARRDGPGVAGLFLAFPAIFPGRGYVDREAREGEKAASRFRWYFKRQSRRRHRCGRSGGGGPQPAIGRAHAVS